ncbi:MAG TPA: glycosyltransferase [Pyrinomonadaceae bacterium]|nr:glycosyltransferase [Pyrinomonadaceae bacterium]
MPKNDDPPLTPRSPSTLKGRRIVFVLFNLELGGAERQALILAKHLVETEEAAVEVWGFNKSGPVAGLCDQLGVPWRLVPFPFKRGRIARSFGLARVALSLRRARPDILLPYTFVPNVVCGLVWKWTGARACVWNQRDEGVMRFVAEWARSAVRRTTRFVSNSDAGARFLIDKLNVDPAKVTVIENGISPSPAEGDRSAWRTRLNIGNDSFVACMVANLHDNKDHRTLLKAWQRVIESLNGRKAVLVLAGRHDGAYESLASLSRELNLNGHVRFAGQVLDVPGLLKAADIGVFSSVTEGCPNGVLESMAAGLAVAATNIDAIRLVLGPNGLQFLAPPGDDAALAGAILKLANDSELRVTIGNENQQRVNERYAAARMCEQTVAVLKEVLSDAIDR